MKKMIISSLAAAVAAACVGIRGTMPDGMRICGLVIGYYLFWAAGYGVLDWIEEKIKKEDQKMTGRDKLVLRYIDLLHQHVMIPHGIGWKPEYEGLDKRLRKEMNEIRAELGLEPVKAFPETEETPGAATPKGRNE